MRPGTKGNKQNIEAILFDMNGTLRRREAHEPTQLAASRRLQELLEKDDVSDIYWEELSHRYRTYSLWAQERLVQLSESEIWTHWILPDANPEQIGPVAAELTLAMSERKGRMVPNKFATETIVELKRRGYRLGIISNSISALDIPRSLDAFGWKDHFEVVILSSAVKYRKPAPEIFQAATNRMNIDPALCAYLGNRVMKDIMGCKQAGFGMGIILQSPGDPQRDDQKTSIQPDAVINCLKELLDIFPSRVFLKAEAESQRDNSSSI
jgi:putative hydrolase of the HAD superfamily